MQKVIKEIWKIPPVIVLLGQRWQIKTVTGFKHNELCIGSTNLQDRIISLKMGHKEMQMILMHELSHCFVNITRIGTERNCDEEIYASLSSLFWTQVFNQLELIKKIKIKNKIKEDKIKK